MKNKENLYIITLLLLVFLSKIPTDLYVPALANIQQQLNVTVDQTKLTMSIFMLGFASSLILSPLLTKKYGNRRVILCSLGLYISSSIICTIINGIHIIIFLRFIQGLGIGAGTILTRLIVNQKYTDYNKIKILSYFSTLAALSSVLMPVFGGYINEYLGWQYIFLTIGLFGILVFCLVKKFIDKDQGSGVITYKDTLKNYYLLMKNLNYLEIIVINVGAWCTYFVYVNSVSFIFQNNFGFSSVKFSYYFSFAFVGYVIGTILLRVFAKTVDLHKLVYIMARIFFTTAFLMWVLEITINNNPTTISIFFFIILICVGTFLPACQAITLSRFKHFSNDALSLFFFLQFGLTAIFSILLNGIKGDLQIIMIYTTLLLSLIIFLLARNIFLLTKE